MTCTGLLGFAWLMLMSIGAIVAQPVATYDQRQEGKINVQVDVKDLQIVALVDSDFIADYSYDYPLYDDADFTVKPSTKRTTPKPSSTTSEPISEGTSSSDSASSTVADSTTAKATEESVVNDTTLAITNNTSKMSESTTTNDQVSSTESTTSNASTSNAESTTIRRALGSAEPRKRCPMGFQMRSGRCFKRRHSLISPRAALMKLAPALLGKSQLFSRHSGANS